MASSRVLLAAYDCQTIGLMVHRDLALARATLPRS